ncbi:MAG: glycerophosphodiester phosphodiesterase [Ilumatobacteraceae bacterium]
MVGRPSAPHPFLEWDGVLAFAHRGGLSEAPENTLAAFQHAVELGFTYLETDVHLTSDGVLVAFHDPDLERTCGIDGKINDLSWDAISEARVDGTHPIPQFVDLLDSFPHARINVDCKSDEALQPLISLLSERDCLDRICVGSFSDRRLRAVRRAFGNRVCPRLGPVETTRLTAGAPTPKGAFAAQVPPAAGKLPLVTERFVARAHRRGLQVHVWTIDDADEMNRLLDLGVDGIMTDRPEVLKDVLQQRGQW